MLIICMQAVLIGRSPVVDEQVALGCPHGKVPACLGQDMLIICTQAVLIGRSPVVDQQVALGCPHGEVFARLGPGQRGEHLRLEVCLDFLHLLVQWRPNHDDGVAIRDNGQLLAVGVPLQTSFAGSS